MARRAVTLPRTAVDEGVSAIRARGEELGYRETRGAGDWAGAGSVPRLGVMGSVQGGRSIEWQISEVGEEVHLQATHRHSSGIYIDTGELHEAMESLRFILEGGPPPSSRFVDGFGFRSFLGAAGALCIAFAYSFRPDAKLMVTPCMFAFAISTIAVVGGRIRPALAGSRYKTWVGLRYGRLSLALVAAAGLIVATLLL